MAIKGYLNEINFVEVLRIIGKHNGRLGIWNFSDGKQYECFFQDNNVIYLNFNGVNVQSVEEVKKVMLELNDDKTSYYAFQPDTFSALSRPIISVAELLRFSLSKPILNTINQDDLPNLQTKFETVNKLHFSLQGELEEFWNKTINMLHQGCTGAELCSLYHFPEREVQEALYKLRTTGLIKPVRIFKSADPHLRTKMLSQNLNKLANRKNVGSNIQQTQKPLFSVQAESVNAVTHHVSPPVEKPVFVSPMPVEKLSAQSDSAQIIEAIPPQNPILAQDYATKTLTAPSFADISSQSVSVSPVKEEISTAPVNAIETVNFPNPVKPEPKIELSVQTQDTQQNNHYNPLPSAAKSYSDSHGGLIKRMLRSLFK